MIRACGDNVDTKEAEQAVVRIVPSLSAGRVLITSRIKDWPATIRRQQIETLSLDEAQRFLLERTAEDRNRKDDDEGQALRLAEELGGLPLALEQAAAYIDQRQMSLAEYLEEWEKEHEKVLNWYDSSVMQYPAPVAVTWQKTFQQLSPTAAAILRLTAFLAPNPIPSKMFEEGAEIVEAAVESLCAEIERPPIIQPIREAISELTSYSMATREGESFTVHRMVQDALKSRISRERRRNWIEKALRLVDDFSPRSPDDVRTWPIWDLLQPHATRVIQLAEETGITNPTSRLMNEVALLLLAKGLYKDAEVLLLRAVDLTESTLGPNDLETARCLSNLASLLQDTNRLTEAESLMGRTLQIFEDSLGPMHPSVAVQLNNLAQLIQATPRWKDAEILMRRALQIDEYAFGPQHPDVAIDLNNLAQLLRITERLEEAEPLMRRALQIFESSSGAEHPDVAVQLSNLASLLQETDRLAEAEPLMRRALQIDESSFGPQHPNVAIDLNNLATLLLQTNRLEEAEPLIRKATEIWERSLGPEHPDTQLGRSNLAALLEELASQSEPPSKGDKA